MSMHVSIDVHVESDDMIVGGHRPGIVSIGTVTLFFNDALWGSGSVVAMKNLRDELDRQIDVILVKQAQSVSAPADPEPIPLGAPIEQVAAPYMTPVEVLPQGQTVEETAELIVDIASGVVLKDRTGEAGRIFTEYDVPF